MSLLELLIHPDKRLRNIAKPVEKFDGTLKNIAENMLSTMYEAHGIGLAAPQVNIQQRIVVMDVPEVREETSTTQTPHTKLIMINPEIISASEETALWQEGCLSLPGQYADVERPKNIRYRYYDLDGNSHEADAEGLLCVCIQHEIDHLNGVLFIDYLSRLKRERLEKKLAKFLQQKAKQSA